MKTLTVLIMKDGNSYFAQGLEVDYASCAKTIVECKRTFIKGLTLTIEEYIKRNKHYDKLLKIAPQKYWDQYYILPSDEIIEQNINADTYKSLLNFPFNNIRFISIDSQEM